MNLKRGVIFHNLNGELMNEIKWTDNSPLLDDDFNLDAFNFVRELALDKIKRFVEAQMKDFLKENHISKRRWFKYGIIAECPNFDSLLHKSYILYYKTPFRKLKRKITIEYIV